MIVSGANVLVTGANRGLGAELVEALLERGAARVYAAARDPRSAYRQDPRVTPIELDVTDDASVRAAAERAPDVDILINNAGRSGAGSLLDADLDRARAEMETNYWGVVRTLRAFLPALRERGGAAVTVLSALSWGALPRSGAYSATKAAAWSATNTVRAELREAGVQVVGVHVGYMDTDMIAHLDVPKAAPADVARRILDGLEAGDDEVLADEPTRALKAVLAGPVKGLEL